MKRILLLLTLLVTLAVACSSAASEDEHTGHSMGDSAENTDTTMSMDSDYPDLDTARNKMSDGGTFHVNIEPNVDPVPLNDLHTWTITVMDAEMNPVDDAVITFDGGMPEHDHGFPTEPQVTAGTGAGEYLIEGVKMQMSGWWEMNFDIRSGDLADSVTFNIVLP